MRSQTRAASSVHEARWWRAVALFVLACAGCGARSPAKPRPPHILWIVADDMSLELGAYGDRVARTPNLDRLAAEGVRFTNAFATSPTCAPSRTALITGVQATSIGAQHHRSDDGGYRPVPPREVKTFTEYLRAAGYYAGNVIKLDYQFTGVASDAPITNWDQELLGDWDNRGPDQPFFLYATDLATHESQLFQDNGHTETDPASVVLPPYYPDTPTVRADFARYYDNVALLDRHTGELLDRLEQEGLAEDTIVFFFSDNGRPLPRDKRWLYDGGLRGPLLVRWPGHLQAGTTRDDLVSYLDFAPTVLALAGLEVPAQMQGRIFLGDRTQPPPELIFATADRRDEVTDRMRAVSDGRWKYIRNQMPEVPYGAPIAYRDQLAMAKELRQLADAGLLAPPTDWFARPDKPDEELYDTTADPFELDNLAADPAHASDLERLRAAEARWASDTGDTGDVPEPQLRERFWPGGVQPVTPAPTVEPTALADGRVQVELASQVPGASLAYSLADGQAGSWRLYVAPVVLARGQTLHAVAVRYGWARSAESVYSF